MKKFRPHKSGLAESLAETKEFRTLWGMKRYIVKYHDNAFKVSDIVIEKDVHHDLRCGWNTQYVCVKRYFNDDYMAMYDCPQCIGMCDLGVKHDKHGV